MAETGGNIGAGRASSGSLGSATSSCKDDAAVEPLEEKSSPGLTSIKLPSPWSPQAGLDELHFPRVPAPCSFACQLPGGLCIHQRRTKAERAFAFENPLVFYFFSAPAQHLLEEKCFVAERFTVKQPTLRSSASWPFSSSSAVLWENGPSSATGLGGDWGMGGSQQLQLP